MTVETPLHSTELLCRGDTLPPVVVVGLPRSGSTFLSHVMSQTEDWWVFDDFYLLREALARSAAGPLDGAQLDGLIEFLGWQVRARIYFEKDFLRPDLTIADVDQMCLAVRAACGDEQVTWSDLMREWLLRLARHHGCSRWGYKTPQDFMHLDALAESFPGLRVVFLVRDPRQVMASLKFLSGKDGSRGQYHPLVYARYWRMAAEVVAERAQAIGFPLHSVRFEDLVADPTAEGQRIAKFLGSALAGEIPAMSTNTTFPEGQRREITQTDGWILERIAGDAMEGLGYEKTGKGPRLWDLPDLLWISLRFAGYQTIRMIREPGSRHAVATFLRTLFGRPAPRGSQKR